MTSLIIGIDTGGTYTDAVVLDLAARKILASAKAITTKGDLAVGVNEAMRAAIASLKDFAVSSVVMVSVSTTLATNAVVEGHGGAAGLVLVGFDADMLERSGLQKAFPAMPILRMDGGHDHTGAETAKLDVAILREWVKTQDGATAFAVAARFAVRNPDHELAVADIIRKETGKAVTMSHELASALDAPRRAQTAVLNARLVSRILDLKVAVEQAMKGLNLDCPLMLVKGDGSLALASEVVKRPIETVLSGPAASLIGAQWLSGLSDFIMSDMGGTTTDVGLLQGGLPQVAAQGAEVGGWRTMVRAIDIKTLGLGGDSEVYVEPNGTVKLGPERALPVSLLASRRPEVLAMLAADLAEERGGSQLGKFLVLPFGQKSARAVAGLSQREAEVLAQISEEPVSLRKIAVSSAAQRAIVNLRKRGLVQLCALTPSDAAHVLKKQANWNAEAAEIAVKLSARFADMKMPDEARVQSFALQIWAVAVQESVRAILDVALGQPAEGPLVDVVMRGTGTKGLVKVSLQPEIPIVAVGGPVRIYYPAVGQRLNCEVVFAPHCDVANAVGAAAGQVVAQAVVEIEGDGQGLFRVSGQGAVLTLHSGLEAVAMASARAEAAARQAALAQGVGECQVKIDVRKHLMPDAKDDEGLLTATITAVCSGLPARKSIGR